jgi:dTDP-4-dehydrorhamnose reductase
MMNERRTMSNAGSGTRRFIVIGSTGQLGADLLTAFGPAATGLSHADIDVTDSAKTFATIARLRPDWVLNTASYNRVDDAEDDPMLAFQVNALGAWHVARAAAAAGAGVVFFSTDYVFDGTRQTPYGESDSPAPLNVYGASKCAGEQLVRQANPRHLIVRTSALFGATKSRKGWTFPQAILEQARAGREVRVVHDQIMSPTFSADLAANVKKLIEVESTGVFHVTNAGACSWFEFAEEICGAAGVHANLIPITSEQSGRRARRPVYSVLDNARLRAAGLAPMRSWKDALREYLSLTGRASDATPTVAGASG